MKIENIRYIAQDGISYSNAYEYYPFGGTFNSDQKGEGTPFRYNGKELEPDDGLDWYDYAARRYDPALGRFTSIDALAAKCPEVSPYACCVNNPIRLVDIDGRDPGDFFTNPNAAAKDFGRCYNDNSIRDHLEYASSIFEVYKSDGTKGYTYTIPNKGIEKLCTPSEAPLKNKTVATVHAHGQYIKNFYNDKFSGTYLKRPDNDIPITDLKTAKSRDLGSYNAAKIDGYVSTPNGSLQKYDHITGKITTISTNMPCDFNDPTKLNNNFTSIKESNPISTEQILKIQRKIAYDQY